MTLDEAFARLAGVSYEARAARFALARASADVRADPTLLPREPHPLRPAHFSRCAANLDLTYLLRMFAEFEDVCRDYWAAARPGRGRRMTVTLALIDRVAASRGITGAVLVDVHAVRTQRNAVVHDGGRTASVDLVQCRSRLTRFLSYLPRQW